MPMRTGNGLGMRCASFLAAAARRFQVDLFIVPIAGGPTVPCPWVQSLVERWTVCPVAQMRRGWAGVEETLGGIITWEPQVVHFSRLGLAPLASRWLDRPPPRPRLTLDIDDHESRFHAGYAGLLRRERRHAEASVEEELATRCLAAERRWIPRFDAVFVCSQRDASGDLPRPLSGHLTVAPNIYPPPPAVGRGARPPPFEMLFVGNMSYLPNVRAAMRLSCQILPRVRRGGIDARLTIVGANPAPTVRALASPTVRVTGTVEDVGPFYRDCHIVVVPIDVAGGTRIKILEAFACRRPVVATPVAAEGLEVEAGRHLLIAESDAALAESCQRLADDGGERTRLARAAFSLVTERYGRDALERALFDAWGTAPG